MKTLKGISLKGKTVLLRADLNSSISKGKIMESLRFKEHAKTIQTLKKQKAKVIVLSHQGRPGKKDFIGLKQHAQVLNKYVKIKFISDVFGKRALRKISNLKKGEALLLDNVRKTKEEFRPGKNKFVETLEEVSDIFILDALSIAHRKQTSVVSFPKVMPAYAGPVLVGEIKALNKIKNPKKPILYLLGGLKIKDYKGLIKKIQKQEAIIFLNSKKTKDIGLESVKICSGYIKQAKTIFMKGVFGQIENKKYRAGTLGLIKSIAKNKKAFSVLAGGSLSTLIKEEKINTKDFSYVSLSGGALVKYLAGEKLPGLEALKK